MAARGVSKEIQKEAAVVRHPCAVKALARCVPHYLRWRAGVVSAVPRLWLHPNTVNVCDRAP